MKYTEEFNIGDCIAHHDYIGPGMWVCTVTNPYFHVITFPFGCVFYEQNVGIDKDGNEISTASIINSFVDHQFRRKKIRTFINYSLFNEIGCDSILTRSGSDTGGLSFLESTGYKFDKNTGNWYLTKKNFEKYLKENKIELFSKSTLVDIIRL